MSSWYILSSLGLYHFMGTHDYIVTSPLYTNVTIVRDNNFTIKIMAKNNNNENIYINSAWIDNVSFNPITINQDILLSGNHVITYYMNDRPSN
jgi:putative alpha-1,2-mannosidase